MEAYKIREAYAEWIDTEQYDITMTLNTEYGRTFEQISKMIRHMFGGAETQWFGYTKEALAEESYIETKTSFILNEW